MSAGDDSSVADLRAAVDRLAEAVATLARLVDTLLDRVTKLEQGRR